MRFMTDEKSFAAELQLLADNVCGTGVISVRLDSDSDPGVRGGDDSEGNAVREPYDEDKPMPDGPCGTPGCDLCVPVRSPDEVKFYAVARHDDVPYLVCPDTHYDLYHNGHDMGTEVREHHGIYCVTVDDDIMFIPEFNIAYLLMTGGS